MTLSIRAIRAHLGFIRCAVIHFRHPWDIVHVLRGAARSPHSVMLRSGLTLTLRSPGADRFSDLNILVENLVHDQYALERMVHDGDTVVDVGAHIGIFSLLAAHRRPNVRVYAFEPERDNFALLRANIECNPTLAVVAYNNAVSHGVTEGRLFRSDTNTGGHSLVSDGTSFQPVACVDLQGILNGLPHRRIDFLKMDCEGSEFGILLNATDDDLGCVGRIMMEVHETKDTKAFRTDRLFDRLTSCGFNVRTHHTIVYEGRGAFHLVSAIRDEAP